MVISAPARRFAKLSLFLLYLQLFWPFRWLRISVYICTPLTAIFYTGATITIFYPRKREGQFEHLIINPNIIMKQIILPLAAVGLAVDICLLAIPIGAVLRLKLSKKKKVGLVVAFMTGIL